MGILPMRGGHMGPPLRGPVTLGRIIGWFNPSMKDTETPEPADRSLQRTNGAAGTDYRYYNYFTEIEEYFVRRRGKHMLVSPLDWSLIEAWKQTGIPLHVVFRGIDRAIEKRGSGAGGRRINSISYCQPAVLECFEEYQQATLGESPAPGGAADNAAALARALEDLRDRLRAAAAEFPDGEAVGRVTRILSGLLEEIAAGRAPAMPVLEESLQACDGILLESARRHLEPERIEAFRREVEKEVKVYKKRVAAEMSRRIEANLLKRRIREAFGLPEFTLFFLK